ncbi:hypothetical protein B0H14DRAFT_3873595 [Mycena olivaceomarginata]|nr:hypothetical protein B0H14DRAFT_3873595 [Mycena olivaceomarginata]
MASAQPCTIKSSPLHRRAREPNGHLPVPGDVAGLDHALEQREDSDASRSFLECMPARQTQRDLEEHLAIGQSEYCQYCDESFCDSEDLEYHCQMDHSYCAECQRVFKNEFTLEEHYRQSAFHHYCDACKKLFLSVNNLKNHLNSSIHLPKDVLCPGKGCGLTFVSRSAVLLHLESGTCRCGTDRRTIDRLVRQFDTNNNITKPSRLLQGANEVTFTASEHAWNGVAYECYLCHAGYRTLAALNQHLGSPRHQEKVYVCPLNVCRVRFSTLSGLWQHIESGQCGVARFVRNTMDDLMERMRLLSAH